MLNNCYRFQYEIHIIHVTRPSTCPGVLRMRFFVSPSTYLIRVWNTLIFFAANILVTFYVLGDIVSWIDVY